MIATSPEMSLQNAIQQRDFDCGYAALKYMHHQGVSKLDALQFLETLRANCGDEEAGDFVLELMDVVSGWCAPSVRIWSAE
jgi:hypothetical protein